MSFLSPGVINAIAEKHFGPNVILDQQTSTELAQLVQKNIKTITNLAIQLAKMRNERLSSAQNSRPPTVLTTEDIHAAATIVLEKELSTASYFSSTLIATNPSVKRKYQFHHYQSRLNDLNQSTSGQYYNSGNVGANTNIVTKNFTKPDTLPSIALGVQGTHQRKLNCIEKQQSNSYYTQTEFTASTSMNNKINIPEQYMNSPFQSLHDSLDSIDDNHDQNQSSLQTNSINFAHTHDYTDTNTMSDTIPQLPASVQLKNAKSKEKPLENDQNIQPLQEDFNAAETTSVKRQRRSSRSGN